MGNKPGSPSHQGNTNDERGNGTRRAAATAWRKYGGKYNVMCILAGNSYNIDQLKGRQATEAIYIGGYKYMIYVFHSGLFVNYGDGGYVNWAFRGKFTRTGGSVHFYAN